MLLREQGLNNVLEIERINVDYNINIHVINSHTFSFLITKPIGSE